MRQLTSKQKKVLDAFIKTQLETSEFADAPLTGGRYSLHWDDLPNTVIEDLERINDTEILWQETNRYLDDKVTEITLKK